MSREIRKKVLSEYFKELVSGEKTFELRLADWDCEPGDWLVLDEITEDTKELTGRSLKKKVGYVLRTKDLTLFRDDEVDTYGYQIISLLNEDAA